MSIYFSAVDKNIHCQAVAGGAIFRSGSDSIDMSCLKTPEGFNLSFHHSDTVSSLIRVKSESELVNALAKEVKEIFELNKIKNSK